MLIYRYSVKLEPFLGRGHRSTPPHNRTYYTALAQCSVRIVKALRHSIDAGALLLPSMGER